MNTSTPLWRNPATAVWLVLVAATGASWWLGSAGISAAGTASDSHRSLASGGLLVIAAIKLRLVLFHFMEVRWAPWPLRLICDAWLAIVVVGLLLTFRWAAPHL